MRIFTALYEATFTSVTDPYFSPEEDPVRSLTSYFFMTRFNIILPSTSNKKCMVMYIVECQRRAAVSSRGTGFSSRPRSRQCQCSYHTDSQFQPNAALHWTLTNINIPGYTFQLKLVVIIMQILKYMYDYRGNSLLLLLYGYCFCYGTVGKDYEISALHITCILI